MATKKARCVCTAFIPGADEVIGAYCYCESARMMPKYVVLPVRTTRKRAKGKPRSEK